jgi:hypothetical protein
MNFDLNAAVDQALDQKLAERGALLAAQSLLAAGNALRSQAFAMTANIDVRTFAAKPAQLSDGSAIVLLTSLKNVAGTFRLFVSPTKQADGNLVRSILVVAENEVNTLQTQFLTLSDEQSNELHRQLEVIQLPLEGSIELCLALISAPIENYEYFVDPNAPKADEAPADGAGDAAPSGDAALAAGTELAKAADPVDAAPAGTAAAALDAGSNGTAAADVAPAAAEVAN